MTNIEILRPQSAKEIEIAVEKSFDEGRHVMLLYDDEMGDLPDKFLVEYLKVTYTPPHDFVVALSGNDIKTKDDFYAKCRTQIHLADYMGDNLNALHDVLTCEALSPDPTKRTLWVWDNAHVLYSNDSQAFQDLFETMILSASEAISGDLGYIGSTAIPARLVRILLTGRWGVMGDEASRKDSFLYRLRQTLQELQPPDESTKLRTLRISDKEAKNR